MRIVALGEVAEFIRGVTFKPADVSREPTAATVGVMRTKNVQEILNLSDVAYISTGLVRREDQYLRAGDILVSSANSWNLVGRCCWVPQLDLRAVIGGFITGLRVTSDQLDPRYLYHWFSSPRTQSVVRNTANQTTNIANLNLRLCQGLRLPLPPLPEQRRIAAILDHADALRAKRRQVIAHLDDLTQSIFLEMFGDPVSNRHGWQRVQLGSVVPHIASGTSPVCEARPAEADEWAVLKLSSVSYGTFDPGENKAFLGDVSALQQVEVQAGDLLFSRKNTKELVGAVAVVHETPPRRLLPDLIFRLDLDNSRVEAEYLRALLASPQKRPQVVALASGSASSMSNISKARLLNLSIECPPLKLQQKFGRRLHQVSVSRAECQRAARMIDTLFASLQSRAFRGEL